MDDARQVWSLWQSLLKQFQCQFTRGGWVRFSQWVTGLILCPEEHTMTQLLVAMRGEDRWRVLESFAEYGSWHQRNVERQLVKVVEKEQLPDWSGYRVMAVDDTKEHRTSSDVWGTCTFHEPAARSPNRAKTVRAHNWVVTGELIPGKPWTYLPQAARLYFRKNQVPNGERFQTKTDAAVEMLRQAGAESEKPILAVFDGGYAKESVIGPCIDPAAGSRRIDFVTRLRRDARLYQPLEPPTRKRKVGRPRQWGKRLPAPKECDKWKGPWQSGRAYLYGRTKKFRYKKMRCVWSVTGPQKLVDVYLFHVDGYKKPWFLATSASSLSASQVVAVFATRFRQEDGFRDQKQRLGMEECCAWTKNPVLRTFQSQMIAQTLLRLMQFRMDTLWGEQTWWSPPEWNRGKRHPSLLDVRRLFWHCRERFSKLLFRLEELAKPPQAHFPCGRPTARAA